ncbi:MAG: tRNA 4-thiouridine(8) synthase ThiI [Deltaproteobacteria bacterium]|nr:tRNA 4-thiouridine(8) synthase ThiI [Deltaproteobacteria bacterium]MBI2210853.1 tRNA 4-thiouridine(8) synthase ThiI [Deltaproteobacteria bacterium]MBI2991128.1 tRNA 4-thiouridine(8) synthase ThiI [Deltaproteobacteria bacterium]MBI3060494.1 tRNA 4-thiouridine(8) synthase ThiI [Deltaproteobacteria bacterium]
MTCVLVRYHEVALKKGNRPYFVELLKRNLVSAVKGLGLEEAKSLPARLLLRFGAGGNAEEIRRRIEGVFGVANFSFAERVPRDLDALQAKVLDALDGKRFASFRVDARRADKDFPLTSPEINRRIGAAIKERSGARVDLKNGELTISIEILPRDAFFAFDKTAGAGGLPVGASGRVASLISGGIDSPVAAYRMMQRGCRLIFVHFHSAPYLDGTSQEKVRQLVQILTRHQFASRLYLVPFGEIQRQIVAAVLRPLRVVLYRRMMLRIAEAIARREKASALVTGESLAQVASQTLENMTVIEKAAGLSILRPLVGMDKQEIIDQARRIGTFETSAIPDQDCCQLFVPKHPATKARLADVEDSESRLDLAAMIQLGVEKAEKEEFKFPE